MKITPAQLHELLQWCKDIQQWRVVEGNAMPYEIVQSDDIHELMDNASIILYGDSGVGKTTIAKGMPDPLFLIMSGGGEHEPMPLINSGIPFIRVQSYPMFKEIMTDIKNRSFTLPSRGLTGQYEAIFKKLRSDGRTDTEILSVFSSMGVDTSKITLPKPQRVTTLIFDQLTTMYNIFMKDILANVRRNRDNEETPSQADYGQIRRRVMDMFYDVNSVVGYKKVYLALAEVDRDPETKMLDRGLPMLAGKLASEVMAFVDFMFYMHIYRDQDPKTKAVRVYRRLATQPWGKWQAKDSTGKLPPFIEAPLGFKLWDFMVQEILK